VIGDPPLLTGAANTTSASPSSACALRIVGAPGTPVGVTDEDDVDAGDDPALFCAMTVNVYISPSVRPETVSGLDAPVAVLPSGDEMTV
jgi:hypothetical protein